MSERTEKLRKTWADFRAELEGMLEGTSLPPALAMQMFAPIDQLIEMVAMTYDARVVATDPTPAEVGGSEQPTLPTPAPPDTPPVPTVDDPEVNPP